MAGRLPAGNGFRPLGARLRSREFSGLMERTLILLKPDCVHRRLIGAVLQRFEQKGLRLAGLKQVQVSRSLAEQHYAVHKGKPFYDSLLKFITSGPTVALVLEGREAVAAVRNLMGATDGI